MTNNFNRLDTPSDRLIKRVNRKRNNQTDVVGKVTEGIARFLGTPSFLVYLSIFCIIWIAWNTLMPANIRFDSADLGFTALTLILSLQASYAAPLILLAENRQLDRDRASFDQDRQRSMRNLSETEYLTREISSIKIALNDVATRDFIRSELKEILKELNEEKGNKPT